MSEEAKSSIKPIYNHLYTFFNPCRYVIRPIAGGTNIRPENEQDERVLEYIGNSSLTQKDVFWNANAKEFETVDNSELTHLKEIT